MRPKPFTFGDDYRPIRGGVQLGPARLGARLLSPRPFADKRFPKRTFVASQESMNELLTSAEFLVHVAVPGAVAKPGVTSGGGDAPSWDVEGGGAYVDSRRVSQSPSRARFGSTPPRLARLFVVGRGLFPFKKTPSFGSDVHECERNV